MDHARLQGAEQVAAMHSSHCRLAAIVPLLSSRHRASKAMAVTSRCGAMGIPYTTPFPAFQPPPGHARSSNMSTPRRMRKLTWSVLQQTNPCFRAIIENAVGITQLQVPGIHGQPNLLGSKRT